MSSHEGGGMGEQAAGKLCSVCGADVAKKPRVKDHHGRYFCEPCHARSRSAPRPPHPGEGAVAPAESGRLVMRRAAPGEAIGLADPVQEHEREELETCPDCAMPVRKDADICLACGFNRKTGRPVGTTFDAGPDAPRRLQKNCQKCGYALEGLRTAKCPECGHVNVPRGKGRFVEKEPRQITRWAYILPLAVIGAWAVQQTIFDVMGWGSMLRGAVFMACVAAVGLPVSWLLNLFYIDNEDRLVTLALGTLAMYAGADLVTASLIAAGPLWVAFYMHFVLPILVVHAFWAKPMLDIEWKEAFVCAIPAGFIAIGASIAGYLAMQ